jgi:hypothetical protein
MIPDAFGSEITKIPPTDEVFRGAQFRNRGLGNIDAELEQLAMDAQSAQRVER